MRWQWVACVLCTAFASACHSRTEEAAQAPLSATQPSPAQSVGRLVPPVVDRSSVESTARAFFPIDYWKVRMRQRRLSDGFAAVSFEKGEIEGQLISGELLLEHFGFGWQVINEMDNGHYSSDAAKDPDIGPPPDLEALRGQLAHHFTNEAITGVTIADGYALAGWAGNGGGEELFAKRHGKWQRLTGGGGYMCVRDFERYGIPAAIGRRLYLGHPYC